MKRYILLAALLMLAGSVHAEAYRIIGKDGKVHYSDRLPDEDTDFTELKVAKPPVIDEDMSYETRRAKENFPVVFYSFKKCGSACDQARAFLNKRGIPYTEKDLVTQVEIDEYYKNSGGSELPAMTVGKTWVKGFLDTQWNSELDIAGYPKSSPYRARQPSKTAEVPKNPDASKTIEAPKTE